MRKINASVRSIIYYNNLHIFEKNVTVIEMCYSHLFKTFVSVPLALQIMKKIMS